MAVKKGDDGYLHNDMGEVWGYCRVSTTQQKTDRQEIAMEEYGDQLQKYLLISNLANHLIDQLIKR